MKTWYCRSAMIFHLFVFEHLGHFYEIKICVIIWHPKMCIFTLYDALMKKKSLKCFFYLTGYFRESQKMNEWMRVVLWVQRGFSQCNIKKKTLLAIYMYERMYVCVQKDVIIWFKHLPTYYTGPCLTIESLYLYSCSFFHGLKIDRTITFIVRWFEQNELYPKKLTMVDLFT